MAVVISYLLFLLHFIIFSSGVYINEDAHVLLYIYGFETSARRFFALFYFCAPKAWFSFVTDE